MLMWPRAPAKTICEPQDFASCVTRSKEQYGSFVLATTMLGNGSVLRGMGQKEVSSSVWGLGDTTSAGATRKAPRTLREVFCVQCAMAMVARLCATRIGGVSH